MKKVYLFFNETHNEGKETLGGKGANLAEMTRLGLPIPQDSRLQPVAVWTIWQMLLSLKNTYNQKF